MSAPAIGNTQPPTNPTDPAQHPLANYQFSSDELRVLRECDVESFVQRSVPLGTTFGLAAYMAVKNGYLKGSVRFGAVPKVAIGVIVGYFMGKFSYQNQCAEKIMRLPDSKLAEMLRMRRRGGGAVDSFSVDHGYGAALSMSPFASATDQYSDVTSKSSSLNLDTERPNNFGLDDAFRPNVDGPTTIYDDNLPLSPPKQSTSYDELRRLNREEHQQKQSNPYYGPLQPGDQPPIVRPPVPPTSQEDATTGAAAAGRRQQRNKYGDDWTS